MPVYPKQMRRHLFRLEVNMSNKDLEVKKLFERMREWTCNNKVVFITAKAPPMTQAEIDRANSIPYTCDYIGMLR